MSHSDDYTYFYPPSRHVYSENDCLVVSVRLTRRASDGLHSFSERRDFQKHEPKKKHTSYSPIPKEDLPFIEGADNEEDDAAADELAAALDPRIIIDDAVATLEAFAAFEGTPMNDVERADVLVSRTFKRKIAITPAF